MCERQEVNDPVDNLINKLILDLDTLGYDLEGDEVEGRIILEIKKK